MPRTFKVALTGGLASGKSEALKAFASCGAWTLSLDALARELSRKGKPAWRSIVRSFGKGAVGLDGEIDRRTIAERVFAKPALLRRLERATHPHILREMRRRLRACRKPVAVVEAPLLFEKSLQGGFDASLLVAAPAKTRLERALRRGMSRTDARRRMRAQMPQGRREARADVVLVNEGRLDDFKRAVREMTAAFRLIAISHQGDR
jgi:dephospho-CoA kinase